MIRRDILWKSIIEDLFEDLMSFFYAGLVNELDLSRVEFMDKELQQLFPESNRGTRHADQLVKVAWKNGADLWLWIHIEVQGYHDKKFEERMFRYYYRVFERYGKAVEGLALLTDTRTAYRPSQYLQVGVKSKIQYDFYSVKVIDLDTNELEASDNPFALVLLTAKELAKSSGWSDDELVQAKMRLVRRLLKAGIGKSKIAAILNFIKFYVHFSDPALSLIFEKQVEPLIYKPATMGIIEAIQEELKRQAYTQGLKEGRKEGVKQGVKEGVRQGKELGKTLGEKRGEKVGMEKQLALMIAHFFHKGLEIKEIAQRLDIPPAKVKRFMAKYPDLFEPKS